MKLAFLGFSAEATSPAGYLLISIINPVKKNFLELFGEKEYCPQLDDIFIVFVCTSKEMQADGVYKDRKYVSHKNRYADMRLNIDYDMFLQASNTERLQMVWNVIEESINIVFQRVPTLKKEELLNDIKFCIKKHYRDFL